MQPKVIKSRQPSTSLLESDFGNPIIYRSFSSRGVVRPDRQPVLFSTISRTRARTKP